MGRGSIGAVVILLLWPVVLVVMFEAGQQKQPEPPPPEPTLTTLQRQNAALRDSLEAERGWDTTPPGFIREICEVQNE